MLSRGDCCDATLNFHEVQELERDLKKAAEFEAVQYSRPRILHFPQCQITRMTLSWFFARLLRSFRKHYKSVSTPRKLIPRCKMVPVLAIRWERRPRGRSLHSEKLRYFGTYINFTLTYFITFFFFNLAEFNLIPL